MPNNAGSLTPFTVTGPEGCILNALRPAPVAMRHTLGQVTPDLVLGCLAQALPDRVPAEGASCMFDLPMRHVAGAERHFAIEPVRPYQAIAALPQSLWKRLRSRARHQLITKHFAVTVLCGSVKLNVQN